MIKCVFAILTIFVLFVFPFHDGFAIPGDLDNDNIPDSMDKCPSEPENFNKIEDKDGCPDSEQTNQESQTEIQNQLETDEQTSSVKSSNEIEASGQIESDILKQDTIQTEQSNQNSILDSFTSIFDGNESFFDSDMINFEKIAGSFGTDTSITDLLIFTFSMVAYGIFIWNFYRLIARREIVSLRFKKYESDGRKATSILAYLIKYILVFPAVVFIWFFVYSMFIFLMAPDLPDDLVFLVVIALVIAIRISAYYKEDLAKDFAKLLPFALLGIFLTNSVFFTIEQFTQRLDDFIPFVNKIIGFVVFAFVVEGVLRVCFLIKRKILPVVDQKLEEQIEKQVDEKIKTHTEKLEKQQKKLEEKVEDTHDEIEKKVEKAQDEIEKKVEDTQNGIEKKIKESENQNR